MFLPWRAVADGKDPASYDDLLGSGQRADELGLDGVADGDVALHSEGRQGQSWKLGRKG